MATLNELVADGRLDRLDPGLPATELEIRCVYMSERLTKWIDEKLPKLRSIWDTSFSAEEQFAQLMEDFCGGTTLEFERGFHVLRPDRNGIWELKTPDVRLFGWFHHRDHFIGVLADDATRIKQYDLYNGYCGDVVRFRDGLDLDEPKYIKGSNPNDVVSNFSFP